MKLWLDDCRDPEKFGCSGWEWARTADEAIRLLRNGGITEASLDHDLGFDDGTWSDAGTEHTGYEVIVWLEEHPEFWPRDGVRVHSQNPVGAARMQVVINRYYNSRC